MEKQKLLIIGLIIVIVVLIGLIGLFFTESSNAENIITVGELQLNLTGFETKEINNISIQDGYAVMYDVKGHDDNFQLIISEVPNNANLNEQTLAQYTGYNGVAVSVVIGEHVYWIQICNANSNHQNQDFIHNLILNNNIEEPTNDTSDAGTSTTTSTSNSGSSGSNHKNSGSSEGKGNVIVYEEEGTYEDGTHYVDRILDDGTKIHLEG